MDFTDYKIQLGQLPLGKQLPNAIYVYIDSLKGYADELLDFIDEVKKHINYNTIYNVVKFFKSEFKISFLQYADFFEQPHPALKSYTTVDLATGKIRKYNYSKSVNPPILHRKETLLEPNHPMIKKLQALTKAEEAEGLYENSKIIGFKKNWERLISEKGLAFDGHKLIKSKITCSPSTKTEKHVNVARHKTAITRYNFSKPIQTLFEHGLIYDRK